MVQEKKHAKKNERNNLKSSTCTSDISSIQFDQTRQKNLNKGTECIIYYSHLIG